MARRAHVFDGFGQLEAIALDVVAVGQALLELAHLLTQAHPHVPAHKPDGCSAGWPRALHAQQPSIVLA